MPNLGDLLSESLMAEIRRLGRRVHYGDKELMQMRGDAITGFSIVESGQVIAGSEGVDGSFFMAALLNPGDHFGETSLFAGLPRMQNLHAVGETVVLHVPDARFLDLCNREPDVGRALLTIALRRIHFMLEFMDGQRRWRLEVRIAHLLLTSVADRKQKGDHLVHCRQEDLAELLGVSRVAVSKALKILQGDGRITMGYGSIRINDVQALLAWLNRTYQVVPLEPDPDWRF